MTTFNNLPSIFVPLVGLVFPAIAMASLFLHIQKIRFFRSDET
nr:photosystem I subunit VIII [Cardamine bipinnata]UHY42221.1 photosystem I subunit VIII [Cardamine bipinnata]UHY42476.1 photosystem I subunit VIII [Cardamine bipinnata]